MAKCAPRSRPTIFEAYLPWQRLVQSRFFELSRPQWFGKDLESSGSANGPVRRFTRRAKDTARDGC